MLLPSTFTCPSASPFSLAHALMTCSAGWPLALSLPGDAKKIALAVREHWAIENSLHWVLDVAMNEDMSRVRKDNAPQNLATLRRIAINMVKKDKTPMKGRPSIWRAMKRAAYLNANLEHILIS